VSGGGGSDNEHVSSDVRCSECVNVAYVSVACVSVGSNGEPSCWSGCNGTEEGERVCTEMGVYVDAGGQTEVEGWVGPDGDY